MSCDNITSKEGDAIVPVNLRMHYNSKRNLTIADKPRHASVLMQWRGWLPRTRVIRCRIWSF